LGRPAKALRTAQGARTKEAKARRQAKEDALRGGDARVQCPAYLTDKQKYIFHKIRNLLKGADVLGNVDGYIIAVCAVSIDRVRELDTEMNAGGKAINDRDSVLARSKYLSDFYRCCNELGLSPQARAKLGVLAAGKKKEETDPLLKALQDDED